MVQGIFEILFNFENMALNSSRWQKRAFSFFFFFFFEEGIKNKGSRPNIKNP